GTRWVMLITAVMMVIEIIAGWQFNSMALLADGWHMSSHAVAIGLSAVAYSTARRYAKDPRFAFGTWKIEILAGFSSALFLLGVVAMMLVGSVERLFSPQPIHFTEAIAVAIVGLLVNIVCALILNGVHDQGHAHSHGDHGDHQAHGHDLNLHSAYLHVVADAATSVLAVLALLGGVLYAWNWLDPAMGVLGALLVTRWAQGLIRDTSRILLDCEMDHPVVNEIRDTMARHRGWGIPPQIADIHVWRVGKNKFAVILGLATENPQITPDAVKNLLGQHEELAHISVEVNPMGISQRPCSTRNRVKP
ncbi:MAG: CDF family Co(II)/Ni(II) efflux transporter DmeF, partial [Pseudomonadota bacterium]